LPAGLAEQPDDPGNTQSATLLRVGCGGEHGERIGAGQIVEGGQCGRVVLPQHRPGRVDGALPGPNHRLVRPSCHLDVFGDRGVAGHRPVMDPVQPDNLGQHMRIPRIGLRPRRDVPFPVAGGLDRVDRPHLVAGRDQRLHPRPAIGFNPDQHLIGLIPIAEVVADQSV
jgi:hypothetical protein